MSYYAPAVVGKVVYDRKLPIEVNDPSTLIAALDALSLEYEEFDGLSYEITVESILAADVPLTSKYHALLLDLKNSTETDFAKTYGAVRVELL